MTSLFSRLQKLNKKGTKAPWKWDAEGTVRGGDRNAVFYPHPRTGNSPFDIVNRDEDAELIVECRNSLPAVLNLIEAAQEMELALRFIAEDLENPNGLREVAADLSAAGKSALAVFVEQP